MIVGSFFLMWWQACRSSGSTDIPVRDSAWHTDCSRTSSAISDGTGLISRVSLLLYWALFKLQHSNWVITGPWNRQVRVDHFVFCFKIIKTIISLWKLRINVILKIFKTENFINKFFFFNWLLVCTIFNNNTLENKV